MQKQWLGEVWRPKLAEMFKKEGTEMHQEIKRLPLHNEKSYDVKVPAFRYLYKLCASSTALLNPAGSQGYLYCSFKSLIIYSSQ